MRQKQTAHAFFSVRTAAVGGLSLRRQPDTIVPMRNRPVHLRSAAPPLINFNPTHVTDGFLGAISYISTDTFKGSCTLSCHGKDHKNKSY